MKKRLLSFVLALFLLLGMLPMLANSANAAVTRYWPVPGHTGLSRGYTSGHTAMDVCDANINGATVIASVGGTVCAKYTCGTQHYGSMHDCGGFGTGIVIKGDDGYYYQYAHMQAGSIPGAVYNGARVAAGQQVGRVGTTGNSSGPHLHFQVSSSSQWWTNPVNPQNFSYTYSVPSANYVNLGNDFYAYIKFPSTGHGVCNVNNNVQLGTYGSQSNLWRFVRQSNGSYKIISMLNSTVLDVSGGNTADETNLQTYASNDTIAQRFYIQSAGSGRYNIIAANSMKAMDVKYGSSSTTGTNIHIYSPNGSADQSFQINKAANAGKTGWFQESGRWVYYKNGALVKNSWVMADDDWRYLNANGQITTNTWVKADDGWRYLNASGHIATNLWIMKGGDYYYLDASGRIATNQWLAAGYEWRYVGANGRIVTNGWVKAADGWRYLDASGLVATNLWIMKGGDYYYLDASGRIATNQWLAAGYEWRYVGANGRIVTSDWVKADDGWRYLDASGLIATNVWVTRGGDWYCLGPDGRIITNSWVLAADGWRYVSSNGRIVTNTAYKIGNKTYYFNASGMCMNLYA